MAATAAVGTHSTGMHSSYFCFRIPGGDLSVLNRQNNMNCLNSKSGIGKSSAPRDSTFETLRCIYVFAGFPGKPGDR